MAVTFGNLVATLGRGLLPVADLVALLSGGLFVSAGAPGAPVFASVRLAPAVAATVRLIPM